MHNIKTVILDRIPCWYEVTFRPTMGIVLRIHTDFAKGAKPIPDDAPILECFKQDFDFKSFGGEFGKDFGYENSLKFMDQSGQFLEYHVPACLCRKLSDTKCWKCEGTG